MWLSLNISLQDMIVKDHPDNAEGAIFLPIVFGLDKTTTSVRTRHQVYHPVYMSPGNLTNIACRAHGSAVLPVAFLPIPKRELLATYRLNWSSSTHRFCQQARSTVKAQNTLALSAKCTMPALPRFLNHWLLAWLCLKLSNALMVTFEECFTVLVRVLRIILNKCSSLVLFRTGVLSTLNSYHAWDHSWHRMLGVTPNQNSLMTQMHFEGPITRLISSLLASIPGLYGPIMGSGLIS